jgi:arsenite/tail-anchored protein-transporting ATPase
MATTSQQTDTKVSQQTLTGLLEASSLRWIFVGGKGGVGKTTCSCSLAVQLASVRESVLIISTDPAHNLSDAFRQKFSREPTRVDGFSNLYALEIDPAPEAVDESDTTFLTDIAGSIPGIDEAMSFAEVLKQVQSMSFSVVVFDTAPTGHTLRLLQLPAVLEKALNKLMGHSALGSLFSTMTSMLGGGANDGQGLSSKLEEIKTMVTQVNAQFTDPALTTFVCVAAPEWFSLYETERLVQTLLAQGIDTHNIVVNGILYRQPGSNCSLCAARMSMQQGTSCCAPRNCTRHRLIVCGLVRSVPGSVHGPIR